MTQERGQGDSEMFLLAIRGAPEQGSVVWWPPLLALLPPPLLRAQLQFCTPPLIPTGLACGPQRGTGSQLCDLHTSLIPRHSSGTMTLVLHSSLTSRH